MRTDGKLFELQNFTNNLPKPRHFYRHTVQFCIPESVPFLWETAPLLLSLFFQPEHLHSRKRRKQINPDHLSYGVMFAKGVLLDGG